MSRSLLTLNVLSISIAAVLWVSLVQLFWSRPQLPTPRAPSAAPSRVAQDAEFATDRVPLTSYLVVATKSLFSPTRSETESLLGQQAAGPKPVLPGVVIGGANRRAYLEDPVSKRVVSYAVGDATPGGGLDRIEEDRVVIIGRGGALEVLPQDPNKPKAAAATPGSPPSSATPQTPPQAAPPAPVPSRQLSAPVPAPSTSRVPETGGGAPGGDRFYFGGPLVSGEQPRSLEPQEDR